MNPIVAFIVLLLPTVAFSATVPCQRVFTSDSFALPYNLPLGDQVFTFNIGSDADAAGFVSMELYTEILSANTGDIKIRIQKNGGSLQKIVKNIGGSNSDLYDGTQFFDGAANTVADVAAATTSGVITPISPQDLFSNLGTIASGDTITVYVRSNTAGNSVNAIEIRLNLLGCSTTSAPTTPTPTTTATPTFTCMREWAATGGQSSITPADRDVFFSANIDTNIDSGVFLYWGVYVDIDSAVSNKVTVRVTDQISTVAIIRGNGGANANIWAGVSVYDEASVPVSGVTSYTSDVSPLFPLSGLSNPTSGDTYTVLIKTGDAGGITVNEVKIFAVLRDCGTTVVPTTTSAPTTTPQPTTPSYCYEQFPYQFGIPIPVNFNQADQDLMFTIPIQPNFDNGNFEELMLYVDIDSPLSNQITVRLETGGTTIPLIRGAGGANANIWAGVTIYDSASTRVADVTSYTADVSPIKPISGLGTPTTGQVFTVLIKTSDGSNSATLNSLYLVAKLSGCTGTAVPTTVVPTTPAPPTTTPVPTTIATECVRTYTHTDLPVTLDFVDGYSRPLFISEQTGGDVVWMEVYTDIDADQTELLDLAFSAEGTGERRSLTPGGFGGQVGIFGGTLWKNSASLNIKDVQSTNEPTPIPELAPFEKFDFSGANGMAITIDQELRLVVGYSGTGDVVLNGFYVTFGFTNCQPTVPPPTTAEPTTTEPSTTEPGSTTEPNTVQPK